MRPLYIIISIIWTFSSALALAQPANNKSSIKFSCVIWENLPYPALFFRQGEEFLPLTLLPHQRSEIYPLQGEAALELFIPKNNPDGTPGHQLVGRAVLPQGTKQVLFMILESPKNEKLPLRILGMDDSLESFPVGSFRFLNFTNLQLYVDFAGLNQKLPPQAIEEIQPEIPKLGGFLPFVIKDSKGNIGFQTRLFGQPRGRKMVFIVPSTTPDNPLDVLFLPQIVPAPLPKTTP